MNQRPSPIWERFRTAFGWSIQYNDAIQLYAVCPPNCDGNHDDAQLTFNLDRACAIFRDEVTGLIQAYAEDGKVCYEESGRDCDCVEYSGRIHRDIDATFDAYLELDERIGQWADGPYHLSLVRPSQAKAIRYSSRDLVMEAYEDGHPHHITSRFP